MGTIWHGYELTGNLQCHFGGKALKCMVISSRTNTKKTLYVPPMYACQINVIMKLQRRPYSVLAIEVIYLLVAC